MSGIKCTPYPGTETDDLALLEVPTRDSEGATMGGLHIWIDTAMGREIVGHICEWLEPVVFQIPAPGNRLPAVYHLANVVAPAVPKFIPPSVRHAMRSHEEAYLMGYRQALANHQREPK